MKSTLFSVAVLLAAFIIQSSFRSAPGQFSPRPIPYPDGFRKWTHITTGLIGFQAPQQNKYVGYHHVYANDLAVKGYEKGKFPDGSIIVFDQHDVDTVRTLLKPGARKFIDVMVKDSLAYPQSGGWGFQEFSEGAKPEGLLTNQAGTECFSSCHVYKKENDFVFTSWEK